MDTRSATQQVRLHEWSGIIHARSESGLTVKEFCSQNGITETQYFYWLRKVRASVIETSGMKFVELPAPVEEQSESEGTTGVIIELNGARIQVDSSRCRDTLAMVLEVLGNAQ